jgi:hypothetical protein
MPKFRFMVQSATGKVRRGSLIEADEEAARKRLQAAGFAVLSLNEEAELVVHEQGGSGRPKVAPQRASIIAFEETWWEKIWLGIHTYVLRRETAMLLALAGLIWISVGLLNKPKATGPAELDYKDWKGTVTVDSHGFDRASNIVVSLPDLPYTQSERIDREATGAQTVVVDIQSANIPNRIVVTLVDGNTIEAKGVGEVTLSGDGQFEFQAVLEAVKVE